ncbi:MULTISPECIES: hypothetical protein [Bacillus cereus group]|uniref:hypothetical protein n=1 Tax=Bacillus cereus group TaxID=86661 RepID=UPI000BF58A54|nr:MULTISPECIES: hypothetical protein [Bacillus cereus group]PFZ90777.1 hypothetical protein COL78_26795 [Bacillus wiedmannii]QWH20742.1 hypothetical protein EXW62_27495 [Bacillus mycoides]
MTEMIGINRSRVKEPYVLINDNLNSQGEKARVIKHVEIEEKNLKDFDFTIYSHREVNKALKELFYGKCAYCESIFIQNASGHIEHWRPKKKVTENRDHNGYYWLASEWENLLWACPICNSQGNKGNKFPLIAGSQYAFKSSDDISLEAPLLINPCKENPELHLEYDYEGLIIGTTDKGKKSVEVYGLARPDLTAARIKNANEIRRIIEMILTVISNTAMFIELPDNVKNEAIHERIKENKNFIDEYVAAIQERLKEQSEFTGMNKFLIKAYRNKYKDNKIFMKVTEQLL